MAELFDEFPSLADDMITIRKMDDGDVDALVEITENERVYRYIPPFLFKKSRGNLLAAIRNIGGRDFDKQKHIIAGVYLRDAPEKLIGLAEMFDYKRRAGQITIGYRLNENYWRRGIATRIIALLVRYLSEEIGVPKICAFVMPENVHSARALLKNGFMKSEIAVVGKNWGRRNEATLDEYYYEVRT